jgi:flavin-dependent dehydrogenase
LLLEKKVYPYHKVCGEYISNEVLGYLRHLGFDPFHFNATSITKLRVSDTNGRNFHLQLDLGGFGISRYTMDEALCQLAAKCGAFIETGTRVTDISFAGQGFTVTTTDSMTYTARLVIGSYGKRDVLDKKLNRSFINKRNGYLGVKYHIHTDYPADEIGLDNFEGGYCGISKVDGDRYNLCYLYHRPPGSEPLSIPALEQTVLYKNPMLKTLFTQSDFLFKAPEVINEISFEPKTQVQDHILMCGDTAGLITPLCGNGMSMAITGAKLLTGLILETGILDKQHDLAITRNNLEIKYQKLWNEHFSKRLFWGRTIQRFFGNSSLTNLSLKALHAFPSLQRKLVSYTHGTAIY